MEFYIRWIRKELNLFDDSLIDDKIPLLKMEENLPDLKNDLKTALETYDIEYFGFENAVVKTKFNTLLSKAKFVCKNKKKKLIKINITEMGIEAYDIQTQEILFHYRIGNILDVWVNRHKKLNFIACESFSVQYGYKMVLHVFDCPRRNIGKQMRNWFKNAYDCWLKSRREIKVSPEKSIVEIGVEAEADTLLKITNL